MMLLGADMMHDLVHAYMSGIRWAAYRSSWLFHTRAPPFFVRGCSGGNTCNRSSQGNQLQSTRTWKLLSLHCRWRWRMSLSGLQLGQNWYINPDLSNSLAAHHICCHMLSYAAYTQYRHECYNCLAVHAVHLCWDALTCKMQRLSHGQESMASETQTIGLKHCQRLPGCCCCCNATTWLYTEMKKDEIVRWQRHVHR